MADMTNTMKTILTVDTSQPEKAIVKLNSIASDSTEKLEDRIAAKNKAIETQEKLSKKTISTMKEEIKILEGLGENYKELNKLKKKLATEELKAEKATATNVKQLNKLEKALESSTKKTEAAAKAKKEAAAKAKKQAEAQEKLNKKLASEKAVLDGLSSKRAETQKENIKLQEDIIRLNGIAGDSTKDLETRVKSKNEAIVKSNQLSQKKQKEISEEIEALKKLGGQEARVEKLTNDLNREQTRFNKQAALNTKQLNKLKVAAERSRKPISALSEGFKQMAARFTGAALVAGALIGTLRGIWRGLKDAARRVIEFDKTIQEMAGITRSSREDMANLEATIIEVASKSIKTSNEVAKLASTLLTLGKTKSEVQKLLEPVNNLSIAMKASSDEAGEFLVQTLNAFGESASEAENYANTIAAIRTSTTLDFQKMRDSFQYIAPISKLLNKDLAETGALVGVLADNGLKAESSGRLLATAQIKLATVGKTLKQGLAEISQLYKENKSDIEILSAAGELFGQNAARVGAVLATNTAQMEEYTLKIKDSEGALDDLVNRQLESLDAKLKILDSTWEKFILNVDSGRGAFGKFASDSIEWLTGLISSMDDLNIALEEFSFFEILFKENPDEFTKKIADVVREEKKRLATVDAISEATVKGYELEEGALTKLNKKTVELRIERKKDELKEAKAFRDLSLKKANLTREDKEKIDEDYRKKKESIDKKYAKEAENEYIKNLEAEVEEKQKSGENTLNDEFVLLQKKHNLELNQENLTEEAKEKLTKEYLEKKKALVGEYTQAELDAILKATEDNNAKILAKQREAAEQRFLDDNLKVTKDEEQKKSEAKQKELGKNLDEFTSGQKRDETDSKFAKREAEIEAEKQLEEDRAVFIEDIRKKEAALEEEIYQENIKRLEEDSLKELEKATEGVEDEEAVNEAILASSDALKAQLEEAEAEHQARLNEIKAEAREVENEVEQFKREAEIELGIAEIEKDEQELERLREKGFFLTTLEEDLLAKKLALIEKEASAKKRAYIEEVGAANVNKKVLEKIDKDAAAQSVAVTKAVKTAKIDAALDASEASIGAVAEAFGVEKEAALAISAMRASEALVGVFKTASAKTTVLGRIAHIASGIAQTVAPIFTQIKAIQQARLKERQDNTTSSSAAPSAAIPQTSVGSSVVGDISANNAARLGVDPSLSNSAEASAANRINASSAGEVTFSESRYNDFQKQVAFKEEKTTI